MRFSRSKLTRRMTAGASAIALLASIGASGVLAGGPPSLSFYVDDARYRTVGTPTDFFGTGAPESTYDKIYALGNGLINVAESKPGDRDFNGGRWLVYQVVFVSIAPTQFTNDTDLLDAADNGDVWINPAPVRSFLCPVIPVQGSASGG